MILLVLASLAVRLTWRLILAIAGGVCAFLVLLGLLDRLRPAQSRSRLCRFVLTILDGGVWHIIVRKLVQSITLLFGNPLSLLMAVVPVRFACILAGRPGGRRPPAASVLRAGSASAARALSTVVRWVIGACAQRLRSSEPAAGATMACPLVIAIALTTLGDERAARPVATTRASRDRR